MQITKRLARIFRSTEYALLEVSLMGLSMDIMNMKNNFYILKLRALKHRIYYAKSYDRMNAALRSYKLCSDKKPREQISREINLCKKYWGCYPFHYFRYALYKKDKQLSEEDLLNYIPEFFFYAVFLPYHDSDKYSIMTDDKNLTEILFRRLNIPQPNTLFRLIRSEFYDEFNNMASLQDITNRLKLEHMNKIFMKPADGQGGEGIFIFHNENGEFYTKDRRHFNENTLKALGLNRDYILQEGIEQDTSIARIYDKSVNTFRITTVNNRGKSKVICATLRTGKDGKEVDNGTQGGLVLGLDIETGRFMDYSITETGEKYLFHPDSGFVFKGHNVDKWNHVKHFALDCANKLPHFTYLAWDIALTKSGPVAIETNLGLGIDHYQVPLGGLRKVFGIEDPKFFWRNLNRSNIYFKE